MATDGPGPEVELSWRDRSNNETAFWIERKEDGDVGFTSLGRVPGDTTGYTDGIAVPGVSYVYRVRAFGVTFSGYSTEAPVQKQP